MKAKELFSNVALSTMTKLAQGEQPERRIDRVRFFFELCEANIEKVLQSIVTDHEAMKRGALECRKQSKGTTRKVTESKLEKREVMTQQFSGFTKEC